HRPHCRRRIPSRMHGHFMARWVIPAFSHDRDSASDCAAGSASSPSLSAGVKTSDSLLTQNRIPVGGGPSGKTWPRWQSHRAQRISVRIIPWLRSLVVVTFSSATGWKKLGHPVPLSNLLALENNGSPQQTQA